MNDARTPLIRLASLIALGAFAPACGNLSPGGDSGAEDSDPTVAETGTDDTGQTPTEGGGIQDATIFDVQMGKIPDKTLVEIKGVVVTSPIFVDKKMNGNFFIAEAAGGAFSGIQVFVYPDVIGELESEGNLPAVGDIIDIRALYSEFFDYSELTLANVADLTITGAGKVPPAASVKAADIATGGAKSEDYEGCLVQIEGAKVSAPVIEFGEFEVDNALKVDDLFFLPSPGPQPPVDTTFTALVGLVTYSFEEFKLAPRSCADYQGWDGCSEPVDTDTTTGPAAEVTIYDIQMGKVPDKSPVSVKDVVVTSPVFFDKNMNANFFLAEAGGGEYSGIQVYVYADVAAELQAADALPKVGDKVDIDATYSEFYDYSELTLSAADNLVITGAGTVPAPSVVAPADLATTVVDPNDATKNTHGPKAEAYEGCLVTVEDVTVVAPVVDFGEFQITGGLTVDDLFFVPNPGPQPAQDEAYTSITGLLAYSFSVFKLEPRTADDLVKAP